ncbi:Variediene synthase [Penicillium angulare]|uniref:Variediene synthase n=1 Tax=Penicillium angulare TaxID=116970 RepID=A0A9W9GE26_9EURO|nr:Variediene synthase [Penicillium angulare]
MHESDQQYSADALSHELSRKDPRIHGFCEEYPPRRHNYKNKADEGCLNLRADWEKYIGPIERWGSCNPFEGNFSYVVLPLCLPERLSLLSYIFEYAFLYDNVLESVSKSLLDAGTDGLVLSETDYRTVRSSTGTKQIQSKMLLELLSIDKPCAEVVIDSWKEMVATTAARDKSCIFNGLEDYVEYRIIDTGAPFVDTVMRFGMGILLTKEEEELLAPIARPCFAALGLANDYFSFDIEWQEYQESQDTGKSSTMTNLVWLYTQWEDLSLSQAKEKTMQTVRNFETEYYHAMNLFMSNDKCSANCANYLKSLAYQMPGNVVWSLRCPRYHPELSPEEETLLHFAIKTEEHESTNKSHFIHSDNRTAIHSMPPKKRQNSDSSDAWSSTEESTKSRSSSRTSLDSDRGHENPGKIADRVELDDKKLIAPYEYISSLPSKGIREAFIDALNVWLMLSDSTVQTIKSIAKKLHSSSLMLDDIEDHSDLRRGNPATHTIFGPSSTINSANYLLIDVMNDVHQLDNSRCMTVIIEELTNLFIGQSFDLHWTRQGECPTEEEYLEMVNQKTGGLFRLLARLMNECAQSLQKKYVSYYNLLGKYFQVRDDYKNLIDDVYTNEKGFAEDLDEGKFSFPVVADMNAKDPDLVLQGILRESRTSHSLSVPQKKIALDLLNKEGSMEHTLQTLKKLEVDIRKELDHVEKVSGCENWVMKLLVEKLIV